jgi:hypothetical protein
MILLLILLLAAAVGFGVWRGFGPVQWIWLMAGAALLLMLLWALMLVFVVGPEMRRMGPPGASPGF